MIDMKKYSLVQEWKGPKGQLSPKEQAVQYDERSWKDIWDGLHDNEKNKRLENERICTGEAQNDQFSLWAPEQRIG